MKKVINTILFIFTGKGPLAGELVDAGAIDYSGQGRDRYGR